jgi:hypothetical protein
VDGQPVASPPAGRDAVLATGEGEDATAVDAAVGAAGELVGDREAAGGRGVAAAPDADPGRTEQAPPGPQLEPAAGGVGVQRERRAREGDRAAVRTQPREPAVRPVLHRDPEPRPSATDDAQGARRAESRPAPQAAGRRAVGGPPVGHRPAGADADDDVRGLRETPAAAAPFGLAPVRVHPAGLASRPGRRVGSGRAGGRRLPGVTSAGGEAGGEHGAGDRGERRAPHRAAGGARHAAARGTIRT